MVLKAKNIPFLVLIAISFVPLLQSLLKPGIEEVIDRQDSLLPASARDVVLLTADFSSVPGDVLDSKNLQIVSEIDRALAEMRGLKGYGSLLSTPIVRAQKDEILVVPFILKEWIQSYNPQEISELRAQYGNFPEVWPYLSADFRSCVFYLQPGLTYPSHVLIKQIEELQRSITNRYGIEIEFSGLRAIQVHTERFLTQDILKILPILLLVVSLIYLCIFKNWKALLLAWILKILVTTFSYGCFRLFGGKVSPFIVLVPTFNFGLLSDYFIHMFYHLQGKGGLHSWRSARSYLAVPLTLTAVTSVIGFLSLTVLGGEGHVLLASMVSISIFVVYLLVLGWLPSVSWADGSVSNPARPSGRSISNRIQRALTVIFLEVFKVRYAVLVLGIVAGAVGIVYLPRLKVQPYPLKQFPESSTIIKAESVLNEKFSGTVPFMLEIDTRQAGSFIKKPGLRFLEDVHETLSENPDTGFHNSVLTIIKRMHYYFNNADPVYLAIPDIEDEELFSSLVEQYLLFYSASASPEAYESLIDSNYRTVAIQGILKYRGTASITNFLSSLSRISANLPSDWSVKLSGSLNELVLRKQKLERNWFFSFGLGSVLIFLTVLLFFKSLKMSFISLIPSFYILLVVTGISPLFNIEIDEYTIIIVAISTGLTIDYTIHILNAIRNIRKGSGAGARPNGTRRRLLGYGYSIVRSGGVPVFLSFVTSAAAFASLCLSSFTGAVHFALLLSAALGSAFLIGVFLLPLFFAPGKEISNRRKL